MDFKGQYLTYDEYVELNGTLDKVPFNLLEYDVRKMIDERTFGRLIGIKNIPEEVKICVFRMLEIKERYQILKNQNSSISSENTDGYNVSYRKPELEDLKKENEELNDMMESYLANIVVNNVPVLYLGVDNVS